MVLCAFAGQVVWWWGLPMLHVEWGSEKRGLWVRRDPRTLQILQTDAMQSMLSPTESLLHHSEARARILRHVHVHGFCYDIISVWEAIYNDWILFALHVDPPFITKLVGRSRIFCNFSPLHIKLTLTAQNTATETSNFQLHRDRWWPALLVMMFAGIGRPKNRCLYALHPAVCALNGARLNLDIVCTSDFGMLATLENKTIQSTLLKGCCKALKTL